jgi:hypothetical protein
LAQTRTQLTYNGVETGEWIKNFIEVTVVALKKKTDFVKADIFEQSASPYMLQRW